MDNVQEANNCINIPSSQTFRSYLCNDLFIYFICTLFNNAVSNSGCIVLSDCVMVNNELERMWKKTFVS
jgi:hypothetical protein